MPPIPDAVPSMMSIDHSGAVQHYDEQVYADLRAYYLETRMWSKRLIDGAELRPRRKKSRIDCEDGPGWKALKKRIQQLEIDDNHHEIFRLLHELSQFQQRKGQFPRVVMGQQQQRDDSTSDLHEVVDLSGLPSEDDIIDVDKYIVDVLLVKVIKADPEEEEGNTGAPIEQQDEGSPAKRIKVKVEEETPEPGVAQQSDSIQGSDGLDKAFILRAFACAKDGLAGSQDDTTAHAATARAAAARGLIELSSTSNITDPRQAKNTFLLNALVKDATYARQHLRRLVKKKAKCGKKIKAHYRRAVNYWAAHVDVSEQRIRVFQAQVEKENRRGF